MSDNLIGIWQADPNDVVTQQLYGNVTLDFRSNGELIYTIKEEDKEQKIFMIYEVKGKFLITDQPSSPQKEITEYYLTDEFLELNFNGAKSKYIRVKQKAKG